jgi:inner membrane protein
VDTLTHALIAVIILLAAGLPGFIPFAVIGAVILDADIFFPFISDRSPRLYVFTHGGITHSFAGAVVLSVPAFLVIGVVRATGFVPSPLFAEYGIAAFLIMVAAAFLHLFIDFLACPGIPILAPFSDRKYTPGILPGPSVVIVVLYLACRMGAFLFAAVILPGRRVPMINPFRWLVITENDAAFTIRYYTVFRGFKGAEVIEKFKNTDAREIQPYLDMPEVRRLKFNSYIMTVEKNRSSLVFQDPLRGKGYVWYPHKFREVIISIKDVR